MSAGSWHQAQARRNLLTLSDRFWSRVKKDGAKIIESQCWEWSGAISKNGYGRATSPAGVYAHRASWFIAFGEIPKEVCVCHRCDNRKCVNPSHLFLGTQKDNIADMVEKGRRYQPQLRGPEIGTAKLTELDIRNIRSDPRYQRVIAKDYGITQAYCSKIKLRQTWQHIE